MVNRQIIEEAIRTIRTLTALLVAATFALPAAATDDYTQALKELVTVCPSATAIKVETAAERLLRINEALLSPYDEARSQALVARYMEERYVDDIVEVGLKPYMQEHLGLDELHELLRLWSSPEGQQLLHHQALAEAKDDEIEQMAISAMKRIVKGKAPKDLKPVAGCPESYKDLYFSYYDKSGGGEVAAKMLDGLLSSDPDAEAAGYYAQFKSYFVKNMRTLSLNLSYGVLTEHDLEQGIQVCDTPAWRHLMDGAADMASHAEQMGRAVMVRYVGWLKAQGVEVKR